MNAYALMRLLFISSLTLFLLLNLSCGSSSLIELDGIDDAAEVEVKVEQEVVVRLEGNPTTGYTWTVDDDVGGSLELKGEFESDSNLAGAGGFQILRFQAIKLGKGDLTRIYRRPFETGTDPLREFSVSVVVK